MIAGRSTSRGALSADSRSGFRSGRQGGSAKVTVRESGWRALVHLRRGARTRPRAHRRGECAMHPAMRITNRRGEVIGSVEEWGRLAAPASYKHWKPHRSAYGLARAWGGRAEGGPPLGGGDSG